MKGNMYGIGGLSDVGPERVHNEDYVQYAEPNDRTMLAVIADGAGSADDRPTPSSIAAESIIADVQAICREEPELLAAFPETVLKMCVRAAGRILDAFKMGNDELYAGYASSVTCILLMEEGRICVCHCGNTRLYILRDGRMTQMTADHTVGWRMVDEGLLSQEQYYLHPDRLKLTSSLGMYPDPELQVFSGKIRENDILVLTTDGLHYAVRTEVMAELVLESTSPEEASQTLIAAAKSTGYPDNMSSIVLYRRTK